MFERPWPWLVLSLVLLLLLGSIAAFCASGWLSHVDGYWFGRNWRGYTAVGLLLGVVATLLFVLSFYYSSRKRRDVRGGATMMVWLWVHIYAGLLALGLGIVHGGFGLVSVEFSTGKVLFWPFALLIVSGVAWRIIYATVPKVAATRVQNYSHEAAAERAEEQKLEIEKAAAGRSEGFHRAKDVLLTREASPQELATWMQAVPPEERAALADIARLAASRFRALQRIPLQKKYARWLQSWRVLHVPLALFVVVALVAHIFGATGLSKRVVPASLATTGPLAVFPSSETCRGCHSAIYDQWANSMHAHALTSPLTVIQNNADMRVSLKGAAYPDPRRVCINCHGPTGAQMTKNDFLPLESEGAAREGIGCVACHLQTADVTPGSGGFAAGFQKTMSRGNVFFGPLTAPVGNAFHRSGTAASFDNGEAPLCKGCHNVHLDRNGDGKIEKGVDLVLQTTFDEYREYRSKGGGATCVTCHMPITGATRAAEGAAIPIEQDFRAEPRSVHDHSFVGVDYPLDTVARQDPQKPKREALLKSAARFEQESARIEGDQLKLRLSIENQTGHNLPTGFAFARQMWIELVVKDGRDREVFVSGRLLQPGDDLCDKDTFGDEKNPLRAHVVGCKEVDPSLVNIQLKLVDKVGVAGDKSGVPLRNEQGEFIVSQAEDAHETFLQHVTGGAIARSRAVDKATLAPLAPLARRSYTYVVPLRGVRAGSFTARLLFRNLPPYWVRAMARDQPRGELPRLEPMIANIQTIEMAKVVGVFR